MENRRLRGAMLEAEVTSSRLAELVDVDVKTVQRWLTDDRTPYPTTRHRVARILGHEETYLWPAIVVDELGPDGCGHGVASSWPTRTAVSSDYWHCLFDRALQQIDILVCAGSFLVETLDLIEVLQFKARKGARIRILIADPDGAAVSLRAEELGLTWLPERCRTMWFELAKAQVAGLCARTHDTTMYTSQFRFDDTLLINTHAYGAWSAQSPVLRLEGDEDPLFAFYARAFERVWTSGAGEGSRDPDPECAVAGEPSPAGHPAGQRRLKG